MENFVVGVILVAVIGSAIAYIIKEKKKGGKCIGCPHAKTCQKRKTEKGNGICS